MTVAELANRLIALCAEGHADEPVVVPNRHGMALDHEVLQVLVDDDIAQVRLETRTPRETFLEGGPR